VTTPAFNVSSLRVHPLDAPCVALALSTSGPDPVRDRLESVAALKFQGDRVLERFAGPLGQLPAFFGDAPLVGHDLPQALGFLAAQGIRPGSLRWDVQELGGILLPQARDLTLAGLARLLLQEGAASATDAETTRLVYLALLERAKEVQPSVLQRMAGLASHSPGSLGLLLSALVETTHAVAVGVPGGLDYRALAKRLERPRSLRPSQQVQAVELEEIAFLLGPEGPLSASFPGYESRPEQVAMAQAVARAFYPAAEPHDDDQHHLLVEGGTGIGKSVAYLLPAILFAMRNNTRVVVSTNTINLQEQLVQKDIPDLLAALAGAPGIDASRFRYTQLKGKANYLCLRRWEQMSVADTLSADESRTLAKTLLWLQSTRTGDRAELHLRGRELLVWDRLSAGAFNRCPGARDGACFYRNARERAAAAHLLVVNHALLLSDVQVDGTLLPEYDHLIIDEAHNLEEEATRQLGFRLGQGAVEEMAERLGAVLHGLETALRAAVLEQGRREVMERRLEEAQPPLARVRDRWAQLVAALIAFAAEHRPDGADGELRITSGSRIQPSWSALELVWDNFDHALAEAARGANSLLQSMEGLPPGALPGGEEITLEVGDWLATQAELRHRLTGFVAQPDEAMIYWLGQGGGPLTINGAPLEVGPLLQERLFSQKRTVVLTSATLAVRDVFDHVRGRLGLESPEEVCLGSPFDYQRAALLCVPTDMPEPRAPHYQETLVSTLAQLACVAGGHTMALFTSHASLRATKAGLQQVMAGKGIPVLAQGVDGTPQQLLARFQEQPGMVLLGTSSFWEGVDITNNALRVLVVARLPFNVPTEPLFAARSELYEQPFTQYALPQATLRFRQGFGRLIRSRSDKGAVVVLDGRVHTKAYGKLFLASVPPATTVRTQLAQIPQAVRRWLNDPDWTP
jgi:predicted DnaQ family exonuclease/DinG family helicase